MTNDAAASGAPRFDVVLRGYDRRQVDEHVARMQRVIGRMRADLELARSQPLPIVPAAGAPVNTAGGPPPVPPPPAQQGQPGQQGQRPRPSPRPRPRPAGESPDVVGTFTDRMQSILAQAEDEAAEIRKKARAAAAAETSSARAEVADLARQRDIMIHELNRLRGQLESMLSAPTAKMSPVVRSKPQAAGASAAPTGGSAQTSQGPTSSGPAQPQDAKGSVRGPASNGSAQASGAAAQAGPAAQSAEAATEAGRQPGATQAGGAPSVPAQSSSAQSSSAQVVAAQSGSAAATAPATGPQPVSPPPPPAGAPAKGARGDADPAGAETKLSPIVPPAARPPAEGALFRAKAPDAKGRAPKDQPSKAQDKAPNAPQDGEPSDVEATMKVSAVKPAGDATVVAPAVRPEQKKDARKPGSEVAAGRDRASSPSRSG